MSAHGASPVFAHPVRNAEALVVDDGNIIADFGAGSGHYTLHFAKLLNGSGLHHAGAGSGLAKAGHVYAIDVQQDLLRRIKSEAQRRGFKNVETIWGDVTRSRGSRIADRAVDLVLISNLLFQLEDPAAALKEAWRILKPSGRLAIIDWSDSFCGMGPIKAHVVKKEHALELARAAHFELLHEFPAGAHHYGLIFRLAPHSNI